MSAFEAAAQSLIARVHKEIPLTQAMQLALESHDGSTLKLKVPLAPNINDKGTAFAGSISALGNITGWSLLMLWSAREFAPCRVAIADAHFSFKRPLRSDFHSMVSLPSGEVCRQLLESLQKKGRGKVDLHISLADAEGKAVVLEAQYAVWQEK